MLYKEDNLTGFNHQKNATQVHCHEGGDNCKAEGVAQMVV